MKVVDWGCFVLVVTVIEEEEEDGEAVVVDL